MDPENTNYQPSAKKISDMSLEEFAERKRFIKSIMDGQDGDGFDHFRKLAKAFITKSYIKNITNTDA